MPTVRLHVPLLLLALLLQGAPLRADETARLQASADGQEVIDAAAGLAWSRCVVGMRWEGRGCVGEARLATHAEALGLARTRSEAEGRLWRVPRVTELKHFLDRLGHARDAAALAPAAPDGWYWTSSTRIESEAVNPYAYRNVERGATQRQVDRLVVQAGWAVRQPDGDARGDAAKREKLAVRLVRSLQP